MSIPGVEVIKIISPNYVFVIGIVLAAIGMIALIAGWVSSSRNCDSSISEVFGVIFLAAMVAAAVLLVAGMAIPWTEYKVSIDETAPFLEIYQNFDIKATSKGLFILSPKDSMIVLK